MFTNSNSNSSNITNSTSSSDMENDLPELDSSPLVSESESTIPPSESAESSDEAVVSSDFLLNRNRDQNKNTIRAFVRTIDPNIPDNESIYWNEVPRYDLARNLKFLFNLIISENDDKWHGAFINITLLELNSSNIVTSNITRTYKPDKLLNAVSNISQVRVNAAATESRSDAEFLGDLTTSIGCKVSILRDATHLFGRRRGRGFLKISKLNQLDLSLYGIFNQDQQDKFTTGKCLQAALIKELQWNQMQDPYKDVKWLEDKIQIIKYKLISDSISKMYIQKICNCLDVNIKLTYNEAGKFRTKTYKSKCIKPKDRKKSDYGTTVKNKMSDTNLKLGLYESHWYANSQKIICSSYCLKNFAKVCGFENYTNIVGFYKTGTPRRKTSSIPVHKFIKLLCENPDTYEYPKYDVVTEPTNLLKEAMIEIEKEIDCDITSDMLKVPLKIKTQMSKVTNDEKYRPTLLFKQPSYKEKLDESKSLNKRPISKRPEEYDPTNSREFSWEYIDREILALMLANESRLIEKVYSFKQEKSLKEVGLAVRNSLRKLDENFDQNGFMFTDYHTVKFREYSNLHGIQAMSRVFRGLLCRDNYFDFDMKNAHPVIAEFVYSNYKLPTTYIHNYNINRDKYLKEVTDLNPGLTKGKVKQMYLVALNGGSGLVHKFMKQYNTPPNFKMYVQECRANLEYVCKSDPTKRSQICKAIGMKNCKDLTYHNCLLLEYEAKILNFAIDYFKRNKLIKNDLYTKIFDGFQIVKIPELTKSRIKKILIELNDLVYKEFKIPIKFAVKDIDQQVSINDLDPNYKVKNTYKINKLIKTYKASKTFTTKPFIENTHRVGFFDFETDTNHYDSLKMETKHTEYCVSYKIQNSETKCILGVDCVRELLELIPHRTIMIAHNLDYDFRMLVHNPDLKILDAIYFNNRFMKVQTCYKGKLILFKCSYVLITHKLSMFPKIFNIPNIRKEAFPYNLYKLDTMFNGKNYLIQDALDDLPQDQKEIFIDNIKQLDLVRDVEHFDHLAYVKYYCNQDVNILAKGYEIFRKQVRDELTCTHVNPIDIDFVTSSSSMGDLYMHNLNVYKDVVELKGLTSAYCQQAVYGGVCRTNKNLKWKCLDGQVISKNPSTGKIKIEEEKETEVVDFDCTSLYPSAMAELKSLPKGAPKQIEKKNLNYKYIKNLKLAICTILITKVGKHRNMPIMRTVQGDKCVYNSKLYKGNKYVVSSIKLEDLIEFHKIQFEILDGVYWNDKLNHKMGTSIKKLFQSRLKLKQQNNPAEKGTKQIMNSTYGKTLLKIQTYDNIFVNSDEERIETILKQVRVIEESIELGGGKWHLKAKVEMSDHQNKVFVGIMILDKSQQIMNRLICLAEDNSIRIYYQDTDSIHINKSDIKTLTKLYRAKYNKTLIGNKLSQFHSDFSVPENKQEKGFEPYADCSIFLGKKAYYDRIVCNSKGETIDHIRMKGVPTNCLIRKCEDLKITPKQLYERMFEGETIEFDLTACGVRFMKTKFGTIETLSEFKRKVSF